MKKLRPKALLNVPMTIDFETGRTVKTISEILEFKKGTVIRLDESQKNIVQIYVNKKIRGYGKAVRKEGGMYVKVTEMFKDGRDK